MGEKKADLILKNCSLVNVYSHEILPQTQIAIVNERIAYVGLDASHTLGSKTIVMDLQGKYVTPGFADPHIHIDQFVLPSELAKKSLLCGVTSLFSDPIDIVSVCGYRGFREFVKLTQNLPIRFFHLVPGGLPVDRKFSHGKKLNAYVSSGILSCHEPVNFEQVLERLRLGMWIMIREGSIRRDLKEILP